MTSRYLGGFQCAGEHAPGAGEIGRGIDVDIGRFVAGRNLDAAPASVVPQASQGIAFGEVFERGARSRAEDDRMPADAVKDRIG
jgi:hypothetical protein